MYLLFPTHLFPQIFPQTHAFTFTFTSAHVCYPSYRVDQHKKNGLLHHFVGVLAAEHEGESLVCDLVAILMYPVVRHKKYDLLHPLVVVLAADRFVAFKPAGTIVVAPDHERCELDQIRPLVMVVVVDLDQFYDC